MKKAIALGIILILMVSMVVSSVDISEELKAVVAPFKIVVDGEEKVFETPIVVINDRTYMPLREISETLGMDVGWNGDEKTAVISTKSSALENGFHYEIQFDFELGKGIKFNLYEFTVSNVSGNVELTVSESFKLYKDDSDEKEVTLNATEKIALSLEQADEIAKIIAKISSYRLITTPFSNPYNTYAPSYLERIHLTVKDLATNEENSLEEFNFDEVYKSVWGDYIRVYDDEVKLLIKKLVELSTIQAVNHEGEPPKFDDYERFW